MSYNQQISALRSEYKAQVWNPEDNCIYLHNPKPGAGLDYKHKVLDVELWGRLNGILPENFQSKEQKGQAGAALDADPLLVLEAFEQPFQDLMNDMYTDALSAPVGEAGSIITSKDYSVLQSVIVLGESTHPIIQGVLARFWDDVPTPQLRGDWLDITDAVVFNENVPDGKSVEASKGAATKLISVVVPKHQGAVAQTFRAGRAINMRNVYQELSGRLAQRRLEKENALIAGVLDGTSNTDSSHGVDFGSRLTSGAPYSDKVPNDMWQYFIDLFNGLGAPMDQAACKNIVFNELNNNDFNKGLNEAMSAVTGSSQIGPAKGVDGVTFYRDQALVAATKIWLTNRALSGRIFRGPVISFDINDDEAELIKTVLKSYMVARRLDDTYIIEVSGVSA